MEPIYFTTPEELRDWFDQHAEHETELWVGHYRKSTGRPTLTWEQTVDEALCVGWIDGIRKSLDDERYIQRFTPRKPRSNWSAVNIRRVAELTAEGRMRPAGLAAFERRHEARSAVYSYEQRHDLAFEPDEEARIDANPAARAFWSAQPPSYRKAATWWVMSPKRPETRVRRLDQLIEDSAAGRRIGQFTSPAKRGA